MGFYGNITNINKSTFQFDKIYPNRTEMDDACAEDGVFIGRYVLVDYNEDSILGYVHAQITDEELKNKPVVVGYQEKRENENGEIEILADRFYSGIPEITDDKRAIKEDRLYKIGEETGGSTIAPDTLVLSLGYILTRVRVVQEGGTEEEPIESIQFSVLGIENNNFNPQIFVARTSLGEEEEEESHFVFLREIDDIWDWNKGRFFINHQIDANTYGGANIGRGWDSTVWQKVYKDGAQSYVMVAELNSVVPTFDVAVDAPTVIPQKPYYDADSSNVYYRLHMQPSWGLRVKADEDEEYSDGVKLPSDIKGPYQKRLNYTENLKDLAIYWFKDGFNKYIESIPDYDNDEIKMLPTGKSGNVYYENGTFGYEKIDTYELSMMLPSIGQAISNLWDILYGKGTYTDILGNTLWDKSGTDYNFKYAHPEKKKDGEIIVEDQKIRNTSLEWNTRNGLRAYWEYNAEEEPEITYNKTALNTLAGTINSVHDLMGMIIVEDDNLLNDSTKAKNADPSNIYYDKTTNKYYRKGKKYIFEGNAPIGISGSDMFNPADGNHYRLESYAYDNYDNVYGENKESETPVYEGLINNYYKVINDNNIFENEVYGTFAQSPVAIEDFSIENYSPTEEDEQDYLWWTCDDHVGIEYVHEVAENPKHGSYYKISAERVTGRLEFYTPGNYYLMKNTQLETKQEREQWDIDSIQSVDFDYLNIMNDATLAIALSRNGINLEDENRTIGYKILKNVTVDPSRSSYVLVDVNRKTNEKTEAADPCIVEENGAFVYRWGDLSATLQNKKSIVEQKEVEGENVTIEFYQYDITSFKKISSPSLTNNEKWSLRDWKDYAERNEITGEDLEAFVADLVPDVNLVKRITEPFYTLDVAVNVTTTIKDLIQENGRATTGYYFLYTEEKNVDNIHNDGGQRYYQPIVNPSSQQANSEDWPWYKLTITQVPVYYNLNSGYYIKSGENYLRETASILFLSDLEPAEMPSYYTVDFIPETKTPFIPNLYYYLDNGEYKLAKTFDASKTYYRYIDRYVSNDTSGVYDIGARWNEDIVPIPSGITVSGKRFEWEFQEIPDLAKNMNTLHGLILKTNEMLLSDDNITRDNSTIQGCINLINDILDKFDQLKPAEIVMVDTYGRIHSGDWDSKQRSGYTNIGKPSANVAVPAGDPVAADNERWLKLTTTPGTSGNDYKPHIKLEHTFKSTDDTNTTADKNVANSGDGLNKGNDDTLKLYTPIVDNMGHVIGKNTETVTLPYGFKTIGVKNTTATLNNNTWSTELDSNDTEIIADNTQDKLNIEIDEWLKISATDANNLDKLVFTHEYPYEESPTANTRNMNVLVDNQIVNTIPLETVALDNAGHVKHVNTETVTLPYGFKTITGNGGSLTANNTQDTAAFSGDTWIQATAINDGSSRGIAFTHIGPDANITHTAISDVSPKFGKSFTINDWTFDNKGHKSDGGTHEVTIPAPSITGSGNVVNGATLSSDGDFTLTKVNVGTLALTGYNEAESNPLIAASDTINGAVKKLENVLDNSSTSVNTRISNEITTFKGLINDAESAGTVYGIVNKAKLDLTDYINAQISELTAPANPWGVQINAELDTGVTSISAGAAASAGTKINLINTDAVGYGSAYYDMDDGGIKIKTAGLYKVQGSAVFYLKANTLGKVWITKKSANSNDIVAISGAVESTGTLPTGTTAANLTISLADTLVNLDVDDTIYLYGGATSTECSIKKNSLTYVLLELLSSASQQNNNGGGE